MGPDKVTKGIKLVPEKVTGKVPATGGWDAGSGLLDTNESPHSTIKSIFPTATLHSTAIGKDLIDEWSSRRVQAIKLVYE
jgi:hypothetical protein